MIFHNNLKFNKHILDKIIFNGKRKIRYLKFKCKKFKNFRLLIILYNSLVKSNLMYGSSIWNPDKKGIIEELEKVQHLFLRFVSYKTNAPMNYNEHNYDQIMKIIKLKSLEYSRAKK